jgi:hypothetical protein
MRSALMRGFTLLKVVYLHVISIAFTGTIQRDWYSNFVAAVACECILSVTGAFCA